MHRLPSSALALVIVLAAAPAFAEEPSVPAVTFDEAVAHALARNPTVTAATAEIQRAQAVISEVRAGWLPSVIAGAAYTRLDDDRVLNGKVIAAQDQLSANVTLTVPLLAPQRWVATAHAGEDVDVARRAAASLRRALAVSVARTYLSTLAQHRVVEIAERAHAAAQAHYDFAHKRFVGQYGSRLDEIRAAQDVSSTAAQLESARGQVARLQEALGALLGDGHPVDAVIEPALAETAGDETAIEARADVRRARGELRAAERIVGDDWVAHAPTLVGTLQPFLQTPPTLTQPRTGWQAQLVLSVPLLEGGLRRAQSREHEAERDRRRALLENVLTGANAEIRAARRDGEHSRLARDHARAAAQLSEQALSLSVLAYKEGASTNIEVIDAQRRARDAETTAAVAEDAHRQTLLDLLIASGRFPAAEKRDGR